MKRILFFCEIALLLVVFVGFVLSLVGAVMMGLDNAMYDYYNEGSRQLAGWLLCFVPSIFALIGAAAYFLRRKIAVLEPIGSSLLFVAAFVPCFYIALTHPISQFSFIGMILFFFSSIATLVISHLGKTKI